MSNSLNPINIALALGALATIIGVVTIVTDNDSEAELVVAAAEETAPVQKVPKRQATAGAWGFDEAEGEEGEPELKEDTRPAQDDDGGWGVSDADSSPAPQPPMADTGRSEYTEDSNVGERPGPAVPNGAPPGSGDRVEGLSND
ncbi:hypothetical protein [Altererythrobacter sp. ZODW24]|uniref:hypothetical protein n=1 Tax=Altererythrobacter sp. ZODW24 TaxID=2185142 RepID=UPI000DF80A26|nr:hypothetical protein [Altererythrobacter sp. ZODW24]